LATIVDLLRTRRSVRAFGERTVPDTVLEEMLTAGRLSPSGGNEQPWRFGIVRERALIESIAAASYGQDWIAGAPLVIVLCVVVTGDERGGRDIQKQRFPRHRGAIEAMDGDLYAALNLEEHQTKIAGAHMALEALEHGVGSTWVSRFDVERVAGLLELPDGCLPSELLVMGYPATSGDPREKKTTAEIVFFERWDDRKT
jgi:nitroreductase